jgi:glucan 1,3-beta-glucosidase
MIHDGYQPISSWKNFMPPPDWHDVVLDTHIYAMFSMISKDVSVISKIA